MAFDEAKQTCAIVLHDDRSSRDDVLCGTNILSYGDLAYLIAPGARTLCIVAGKLAPSPDEVSLHVSLAARYGFENRSKATVQVVHDFAEATASHVELFFRDQHLSRADMWRIMQRLDGTVLYREQEITYLDSPAATVESIYIVGRKVDSAYVTNGMTKPIFRSGSARYTILIQISKEMLEYWIEGELMYERVLNGYLPELFRRWDALKVRHSVSIILFGRNRPLPDTLSGAIDMKPSNGTNNSGRDDFFHVLVTDLSSTQWPELLRKLRRAFQEPHLPTNVSFAGTGNMLEAIHMTAMDYANEKTDPHLTSTGTSILAVTAGVGLFETDPDMLKSTTSLLTGNSIGVDIVALSPKPLHSVPLFSYMRSGVYQYALPHWVDISYWTSSASQDQKCWTWPELNSLIKETSLQHLPACSDAEALALPERFSAKYDSHAFSALVSETAEISSKHDEAKNVSTGSADVPKELPVRQNDISTELSDHDDAEQVRLSNKSSSMHKSIERAKRDSLPFYPHLQSSRRISLGPKGLAPSRGVASTNVTTEHVHQGKDSGIYPTPPSSSLHGGIALHIRASLARKPSQQSLSSQEAANEVLASKPIDIQSRQHTTGIDNDNSTSAFGTTVVEHEPKSESSSVLALSETPKVKNQQALNTMQWAIEEEGSDVSPWLTLLNPSHLTRDNMRVASQYRKWQHVFPRPVRSAEFKWTSMCTPAALPLSNEYRPSLMTLEGEMTKTHCTIQQSHAQDGRPSSSQALLQELIALRLTLGFQICPAKQHHPILMSCGNVYHELSCSSSTELQIVEYKPTLTQEVSQQQPKVRYFPQVKHGDIIKRFTARVTFPSYDGMSTLSVPDDGMITHPIRTNSGPRASMRLVLIPVEPPRLGPSSLSSLRELSDEEKRIDGIQRLTQLWQKQRFYTVDEQCHQASIVRTTASPAIRARDPNPLSIEYQTRDPSMVVNAYGPTLTGQLNDADSLIPVFEESDLYHSSTFDVTKLVKQMQETPPKGVDVKDRRWFTRLHLRCFRGDEMVNWLLRVFKDLQTRDEAVAVGNELMKRGIFAHVRHKHIFRDGNYFYQITSAYRTTEYPDTASMFGLRSVPATPAIETFTPKLRPLQGDFEFSGKGTPDLIPVDRKELFLSQMLLYNVDPGEKSDQSEIIRLHYDRIHNPENCYHIRLEWTNTTLKLIRDATARWAALADTHGLRLVQLPLTEACKLHEEQPFDLPVPVRLAVKPPDKTVATPQLDAQSFFPRVPEDPNAYKKALLRRLDFVLDFEAAASFPAKLDVKYSWGPPEYELTQFVHKTGLLLAQISGDRNSDFLLLPNRLAIQRGSASLKQTSQDGVKDIVKRFVRFCRDEEALNSFYEESTKPHITATSPFVSTAHTAADLDVPKMQLPPHLTHRAVAKGV